MTTAVTSNDLHVPRPAEALAAQAIATTGYAFGGKPIDPDAPACYAKVVDDPANKRPRYYVKVGTTGGDAGQMLNPYSGSFMPGDEAKANKMAGTMRYQFKKINKEAFDFYLSFLKSRNAQFLRRAQRALE